MTSFLQIQRPTSFPRCHFDMSDCQPHTVSTAFLDDHEASRFTDLLQAQTTSVTPHNRTLLFRAGLTPKIISARDFAFNNLQDQGLHNPGKYIDFQG